METQRRGPKPIDKEKPRGRRRAYLPDRSHEANASRKEYIMIIQIENPIRRMYEQFKSEHPCSIMIVRDRSLYTAYYEDVEPISKALEFIYDEEQKPERVTFSYIYLDIVLPRLVRKGYRVAICETYKQK